MDAVLQYWESGKTQYELSLKNGDPRVAEWPLMQTPLPSLLLSIGYLVMCYVGPRIMAPFNPLELKPLLIVYNFAVVILSAYMFYEFFVTTYYLNFNYWCDLVVYSNEHYAMRLASVIWLYYFSKIIELLDTVFFILRKKNSQISVLHIYHHSTMIVLWWIGTKWFAGGASFFSAMINCFVHTIMYSYYLLSALGPALRPYLWWKKYLTMLQLTQFAVILVHVAIALYHDCRYDVRPQWALLVYMLSHLALFTNFYKRTYTKGGRREGGRSSATPNGDAHKQNSQGSADKKEQ